MLQSPGGFSVPAFREREAVSCKVYAEYPRTLDLSSHPCCFLL